MKGLILKDIIAIRKYAKQFFLMASVFLVVAITLKSPSYIAFMFMLFGCMAIITSFSYDETVGWNKYAFSLPLNKSEVVLSKYISWFLMSLAAGMIAVLAGIFMCFFFQQSFKEFLISQLAVSCVYIMMFAILIPFLFKLGVEKGRIVMLGIFLLPTVLGLLAQKMLKASNISIDWDSVVEKGIYLLPVFVIVVVLVSYLASVKIVKQKEW